MIINSKTILLALGAMLLLAILYVGISQPSSVRAAEGIVVEEAEGQLTNVFEPSTDLLSRAGDVGPRIIVEYGGASYSSGLDESEDLEQIADTTTPRIVVEYAGDISHSMLQKADGLDSVAGATSQRIVVEYAESISHSTLQGSDALGSVADATSQRIVVEYAGDISHSMLQKADGLDSVAGATSQRIVVEYAGDISHSMLQKADGLDSVAGATSQRIVVEYAESITAKEMTFLPFLPEPVDLAITPSGFSLLPGESITFIATLRDFSGNPMAGVSINWSSSVGVFAPLSGVTDSQGVVSTVHTCSASGVYEETSVNVTASFAGSESYRSTVTQMSGTVNPLARGTPPANLLPLPIDISGSNSELTDYQVEVMLTNPLLLANIADDGSDLRFYTSKVPDPYGGRGLSYWIEEITPYQLRVWVKVPSIPTSGARIYMYYGHPDALPLSNGHETFIFFEDFEGEDNWTYQETDPDFAHETVDGSLKLYFEGDTTPAGTYAEVYQDISLPEVTMLQVWFSYRSTTNYLSDGYGEIQVSIDDLDGWHRDLFPQTDQWYSRHGVGRISGSPISSIRLALRLLSLNDSCAGATYNCAGYWDNVIVHKTAFGSPPVASITLQTATLSIETDRDTVTPGEAATITATLKDAEGNPMSGQTIYWTSDYEGDFDSSSYTNNQGQATIQYYPPHLSTDTLATITATFSGKGIYEECSNSVSLTVKDYVAEPAGSPGFSFSLSTLIWILVVTMFGPGVTLGTISFLGIKIRDAIRGI